MKTEKQPKFQDLYWILKRRFDGLQEALEGRKKADPECLNLIIRDLCVTEKTESDKQTWNEKAVNSARLLSA